MRTKLLLLLMLVGISAKSQNYVPDKARNFTMVYFVPQGVTPPAGYQERLSEVILNGQQWFSNQMHRAGYDDANGVGKTFGLIKDAAARRVQIILVQGSQPPEGYATDANGKIINEVTTYLNANGLKSSNHVAIIYTGIPNGPYNGSGKYCVLTDNPNQTGPGAVDPGMYHEMAHALNVPHDQEKKSELDNPNFGMGLMGSYGIYNFNKAFLTDADCAILNVNEVFNTDNQTYYTPVTAAITSIHGVYNSANRAIEVSGKFQSSVAVKNILYYNDPNFENEGVGTNRDYNSITWESKPIGTDSFFVSIPIDEFVIRYPAANSDPYIYPYELKVKTVHANGVVKEDNIFYFTFNDEKLPIMPYSIPINNVAVSRSDWQATAGSKTFGANTFIDQNANSGNEAASAAIDNDLTTFWHSKYSGIAAEQQVFPHELIIDTKSVQNFVGWSCHQRLGRSRSIKDVDVYGGDASGSYTLIKSFTIDNREGVRYFGFDSFKSFRYFKIVAKSAYDGQAFAALADVKLYKGPNPALTPPVAPSTLVDKTGWTVKAGTKNNTSGGTTFEDENNNGTSGNERAESVLDNNNGSFWHSKYANLSAAEQAFDHELIIDTKSVQRFTGWAYVQRSGSGSLRRIKNVDIYAGDDNEVYTSIGSFTLLDNELLNKLSFAPKNFRYFKIVAKSAYDNDKFAALAEVRLYNDVNMPTLPVSFTSFTTKASGNSVRLNWRTASEQNSSVFDVVSIGDNGAKTSIAKVAAAGNSSAPLDYQVTDYNPKSGINYYQVLQYDKDNTLATSSEVKGATVFVDKATLNITSVAKGAVNFDIVTEKAGTYNIFLTNVLGQRVGSKKITLQAGSNSLSFNFQGAGVYVISVESSDGKLAKKFVAL